MRTRSIAMTVASLMFGALLVGQPTPDAKQEKIAALKESLAKNQAQLKQYAWTENTQIALKGEVKKQEQKQCQYGPDGKVQKIPMEAAAQPQQQQGGGRRGGRLKKEVVEKKVGEKDAAQLREDVELIEGVYGDFDAKPYLAGKTAPVFFGSAINNFGVKELLDTFIRIAPEPRSMETTTRVVNVQEDKFSGFIFKIHANLDPRHRDRIAFLRVCSGRFERNRFFHHVRLDKDVRFSNPYSFMAREKDVIEEAFPGDVVGLFDTGNFKIGDTLTEGEDFYFTGIPSFSPEIFKEVVNKDPMKTKQLEKGLLQLTDEGVAQLFTQVNGNRKIIGCVGELQFEVIQYRLLQEYSASVQFNALPYYKACWITSDDKKKLEDFTRFKTTNVVTDKDGHLVYLAQSEWFLNTEIVNNPDIQFHFSSEIHK